jgi:hypothetical protein
MPLRPQLIEVPLSTGLNQKADPRSLALTGAVTMQNCVCLKDGRIQKRAGHATLSKQIISNGNVSTNFAAAVAGGALSGAPWMTDGQQLCTYSDQAARWAGIDVVPEAIALDRIPVDTGAVTTSDIDCVCVNGFVHIAYMVGTTVWMLVLDASTGAVVAVPAAIATPAYYPRLIAAGSNVVLAYTSVNTLWGIVFASGSTAISVGPTIVVTTGATGNPFDAVPIVGDPTRFFVCVEHPSGTVVCSTIVVSTLAVAVTRNFGLSGGATTVNTFGARATSGETIWVACTPVNGVSTKQVVVFALNDDGTLSVRGTQLVVYSLAGSDFRAKVGIERIDATHACCVWSGTATPSMANSWTMAQNLAISGGAVALSGGSYYTGGAMVQSRPTLIGSYCYALVTTPSLLQGTAFLARVDAYNQGSYSFTGGLYGSNALAPVALIAPRLATAFPYASSTVSSNLANIPAMGANVWGAVGFASSSSTTQSAYLYPFDLSSTKRFSVGELYLDEAIAAGEPSALDGNNVFPVGFETYPEISCAAVGSGGSLSAGQYQYTVIYRMVDSRGQVHRSSNGNVVTLTCVNNDSVHVTISILGFTGRRQKTAGSTFQNQVFADIYRTTQTAGAGVFYFVSSNAFPNNPTSATNATGQNTMVVTDTASDASIATNQLLYTTGGVLQNFIPPSSRVCVAHRNRFWLAGCDDPTQIWASRQLTPGEWPGFNEALLFNATGAVRALASLDDKLVVFVQHGANYGIEYLAGDGPNDEGGSSDWTPIQPIPADTGAVDQRSVATGPFGVIFRGTTGGPLGKGGVYLLSRDLQLSYISGPVEDLMATYPAVTSIVVHPTNGRAYIACVDNDAAPSTGVRLVWDYTHGSAWSVDTLIDPDTGFQGPVRCAWVANTSTQGLAYHWANAGGHVSRETPGDPAVSNSMADGGVFVGMTYASAWLKPALDGFARFWRVLVQGQRVDSANLSVTLTFDYSSTYHEIGSWTASQVLSFPLLPLVDLELVPGNQKARAIQVTITDAPPTGGSSFAGAGYTWSALTIEAGVKDGRYQNVPTGQRK